MKSEGTYKEPCRRSYGSSVDASEALPCRKHSGTTELHDDELDHIRRVDA